MRRILASTLTRIPDRSAPAEEPVLWPRWVNGRVQMTRIDARQIPAGWQNVTIRVPMRLATCEETDCPRFLGGWTEVIPGGSAESETREGIVSQAEAAAIFGLYGPRELPPTVIHHNPGTPCPEIHKVPSGVPPIYFVDGRTVLWNQFEDAIAGGLHTAQRLVQEGY